MHWKGSGKTLLRTLDNHKVMPQSHAFYSLG